MAKSKAVARKRRSYEYDHEYGLSVRAGKTSSASRGGAARGATSPARATATKRKTSTKPR